jgi:predicted NodU family carbamoyl transferase
MEFGPRALCNTSTLSLPTLQNAEFINKMNDRTNEMPFALVMTDGQAKDLFEDIDKIHRSLEYMIVTRRFKRGKQVGLEGGAHYYPLQDMYTCRPQITRDPLMVSLLEEFGPLINTSFNYHGQPIVYDQKTIEAAHENESKYYNITTIVEE